MTAILWHFKPFAIVLLLVLAAGSAAISQQTAHQGDLGAKSRPYPQSKQLRNFIRLAADANIVYIYPQGFKEIQALHNDNFAFDFALELPGQDFEVWFNVRSQKKIWANYLKMVNDTLKTSENPDSLYNRTGLNLAELLGGGQSYFTTIIPRDYLERYNATEGKTYLLDLSDTPQTKHYKYALLITLHKDHVGTIVAVCFGNDKGSEFFKNIFKASKCLKFKS